jgi:hypothetical protein
VNAAASNPMAVFIARQRRGRAVVPLTGGQPHWGGILNSRFVRLIRCVLSRGGMPLLFEPLKEQPEFRMQPVAALCSESVKGEP